MTDQESIEIAQRYGLPIVHILPTGVVNEITTVDLRDRNRPKVTREPRAHEQ